eukprot:949513-Rhodomonas_salina.4
MAPAASDTTATHIEHSPSCRTCPSVVASSATRVAEEAAALRLSPTSQIETVAAPSAVPVSLVTITSTAPADATQRHTDTVNHPETERVQTQHQRRSKLIAPDSPTGCCGVGEDTARTAWRSETLRSLW